MKQAMQHLFGNGLLVVALLLVSCMPGDRGSDPAAPDNGQSITAQLPSGALAATGAISLGFTAMAAILPTADECCQDPGVVAECWWRDAEADGAKCTDDADCLTGRCDVAEGLCECTVQSDCDNGTTHNGVCFYDTGLCGPSYCNGFKVCSCWGGCTDSNFGSYANPEEMCTDTASGYPGFCCEGTYPGDTGGTSRGYCSDDPVCNLGCATDAECDDGNPCTDDECISGGCVNTNLDGVPPQSLTCPFDDTILSSDCAEQWCTLGFCDLNFINAGNACTDNPTPDPVTEGYHADCYHQECGGDGTCGAIIDETNRCDDGNNCSDALCDAAGDCIEEPYTDPADLAANPLCCDPANPGSYSDGLICTDDICCEGGNPAPTCTFYDSYYDAFLPDATNDPSCCTDSSQCDDGNSCTTNICCNAFNAGHPACLSGADYQCVLEVDDVAGCCDTAPANLADNCDDIYACTENICCYPGNPDPDCAAVEDYHCAAPRALAAPPAGCCDPTGDPNTYCDDANDCTDQTCDATSMVCSNPPNDRTDLACCGAAIPCLNLDANSCSEEICCNPGAIAGAGPLDPCFGLDPIADVWSCQFQASTATGCCDDVLDCDDAIACSEDTCCTDQLTCGANWYNCSNVPYADGDTDPARPAGCCDPGGDVVTTCDDGSPICTADTCENTTYRCLNTPTLFPGCCGPSAACVDQDGAPCTAEVCCNPGLVAAAGPGDTCDGIANWACNIEASTAPGCCQTDPDADCDDALNCTADSCCIGGACGIDRYTCDSLPYTDTDPARPAGCCDSDADCNDGNFCTDDTCNTGDYACDNLANGNVAAGCCGPADPCSNLDANICTDEICCDAATIAAAGPGDPCDGATEWNCVTEPSTIPGCCDDDGDCDDGNPCTNDTCDLGTNQCQYGEFGMGAAPAGCCASTDDPDVKCADSPDAYDCTLNICCSDADVLDPASDCFGLMPWYCTNELDPALPPGCCEPTFVDTHCNTVVNTCVMATCDNNNCNWSIRAAIPGCCDDDGDCYQNDPVNRPCLTAGLCDLVDDPVLNPGYAACDYTFEPQGTVCDAGDECWDGVCGDPASADPIADKWACDEYDYIPAPPDPAAITCGPPPTIPCGTMWCDGAGACAYHEPAPFPGTNDVCDGDDLGGAPSIFYSDNSVCAADDYTPDVTDIFDDCAGADYGDVVYQFDDYVDDEYDLLHRVVKVTATGPWDPMVHTRGTCEDETTNVGCFDATTGLVAYDVCDDDLNTQKACNDNCDFTTTNYNAAYYGAPFGSCAAAESTAVVGPWAVEDNPNYTAATVPGLQDLNGNGLADGFDVLRYRKSSVFVDSRYSVPVTGGDFDMEVEEESHNNNHCRNTAAYSGAPVVDGQFKWKQRFRGAMDTVDYDNYFGADGPSMGWSTSPATADNPRQAFFKVSIPANSGKYIAMLDWWGKSKKGELGYSTGVDAATQVGSFFLPTLSWLWPDAGDPYECSSSGIITHGHSTVWPTLLAIDTTGGDIDGWLAVGNRFTNSVGDYEMELIRLQPAFLGVVAAFEGRNKLFNGVSPAPNGEMLEDYGVRLDFVPSGATQNGYVVVASNAGSGPDTCPGYTGGPSGEDDLDWGWLVHPDCYSSTYAGGAFYHRTFSGLNSHTQQWITLPFYVPVGDTWYRYFYYDTTGRIEPRETFGSCAVAADCVAYPECAASWTGCSCVADFGNKCAYNPNGIDSAPNTRKFFKPYSDGGYAPVISGGWGGMDPQWMNDKVAGGPGWFTSQIAVFEGHLAFVLSWVGYDIGGKGLQPGNPWRRYGSHVNYQVIIQSDGRITMYYRPGNPQNGMNMTAGGRGGGFLSGISGGGGSTACSADADCATAYGAGALCDTSTNTCYVHEPTIMSTGVYNE